MKRASFPFVLLALLSLSGCASSERQQEAQRESPASPASVQQLVIPHAQGELVLSAVPQTVVVTDWAAFDNLHALGVPVAGVPGGVVPGHLADKLDDTMLRVGSLQEPDIEAIAALQPDLVIVAARSRTSYPVLSRIAPTLDTTVDNSELVEGIRQNLTHYGRIFAREQRAAELIAGIDAKIEQARALVQDRGSALAIVTNGGRMGIYGPQSRVSWLYSELGLPSVFDEVDDRDHGGDAITFEYLVKTDPDWLFVIDRDAGVGSGGAAQALLDNALVAQTGFWKKRQVVYLDPSASYVTMTGYDALMLLLDQVIAGYSAS